MIRRHSVVFFAVGPIKVASHGFSRDGPKTSPDLRLIDRRVAERANPCRHRPPFSTANSSRSEMTACLISGACIVA